MPDGEKAAVYKAKLLARLGVGIGQAMEMRRERRGGRGCWEVVQEEVQNVAAVVPPVDWNSQVSDCRAATYRECLQMPPRLALLSKQASPWFAASQAQISSTW